MLCGGDPTEARTRLPSENVLPQLVIRGSNPFTCLEEMLHQMRESWFSASPKMNNHSWNLSSSFVLCAHPPPLFTLIFVSCVECQNLYEALDLSYNLHFLNLSIFR